MPEQSFPALPEAIDDACAWVGIAVRSLLPHSSGLASTAVDSIRGMLESAVRATPDDQRVTARVTPVAHDLRIEVHHPGRDTGGANFWASLSSLVRDFGTRCTDETGHVAWFRLPVEPQALDKAS